MEMKSINITGVRNKVSAVVSSTKGKAAVIGIGIAVATGTASAQAQTFEAIVFPVDAASLVTVVTAGASLLLTTWAIAFIGFKLVKRLIYRFSNLG